MARRDSGRPSPVPVLDTDAGRYQRELRPPGRGLVEELENWTKAGAKVVTKMSVDAEKKRARTIGDLTYPNAVKSKGWGPAAQAFNEAIDARYESEQRVSLASKADLLKQKHDEPEAGLREFDAYAKGVMAKAGENWPSLAVYFNAQRTTLDAYWRGQVQKREEEAAQLQIASEFEDQKLNLVNMAAGIHALGPETDRDEWVKALWVQRDHLFGAWDRLVEKGTAGLTAPMVASWKRMLQDDVDRTLIRNDFMGQKTLADKELYYERFLERRGWHSNRIHEEPHKTLAGEMRREIAALKAEGRAGALSDKERQRILNAEAAAEVDRFKSLMSFNVFPDRESVEIYSNEVAERLNNPQAKSDILNYWTDAQAAVRIAMFDRGRIPDLGAAAFKSSGKAAIDNASDIISSSLSRRKTDPFGDASAMIRPAPPLYDAEGNPNFLERQRWVNEVNRYRPSDPTPILDKKEVEAWGRRFQNPEDRAAAVSDFYELMKFENGWDPEQLEITAKALAAQGGVVQEDMAALMWLSRRRLPGDHDDIEDMMLNVLESDAYEQGAMERWKKTEVDGIKDWKLSTDELLSQWVGNLYANDPPMRGMILKIAKAQMLRDVVGRTNLPTGDEVSQAASRAVEKTLGKQFLRFQNGQHQASTLVVPPNWANNEYGFMLGVRKEYGYERMLADGGILSKDGSPFTLERFNQFWTQVELSGQIEMVDPQDYRKGYWVKLPDSGNDQLMRYQLRSDGRRFVMHLHGLDENDWTGFNRQRTRKTPDPNVGKTFPQRYIGAEGAVR